jgi:hypothetical protein
MSNIAFECGDDSQQWNHYDIMVLAAGVISVTAFWFGLLVGMFPA